MVRVVLGKGVLVEEVGNDSLLLNSHGEVFRVSGDVREAILLARDEPVEVDWDSALPLIEAGIFEKSEGVSRKKFLTLGAIGLTGGLASLMLPVPAVASSVQVFDGFFDYETVSGREDWYFYLLVNPFDPLSFPNPLPSTDLADVTALEVEVPAQPPGERFYSVKVEYSSLESGNEQIWWGPFPHNRFDPALYRSFYIGTFSWKGSRFSVTFTEATVPG